MATPGPVPVRPWAWCHAHAVPTSTARRIALGVVGATVLASVVALVATVALSFGYRPTGAQAWDGDVPGHGEDPWVRIQRVAALVAAVLALASVVALAVLASRSSGRDRQRAAIGLGGTVAALVGAVVALLTRSLVQWDQLALWAVTVGGGLDGYWTALDDGVRFVLVDGVEVDRGDYAVALGVHLLAHVVAVVGTLGALAAVAWRRPRRSTGRAPERTVVVPAADEADGRGAAGAAG